MNYSGIVKDIVSKLGGEKNIVNAFHCMTRLRFVCIDHEKVDLKAIEAIDGVIGVNVSNDQIQIIIGNDVKKCYAELVKAYPHLEKKEEEKQSKKSSNPIVNFISIVAEIFTPFVPALAGAGMIKALVSIISIYQLLPTDGSTYIILNAMGDGLFNFLPFFIAVSAAKKFEMNTYVAIAIVAAIQHPTIAAMLGSDAPSNFFGLPVNHLNYASTMIHPLMAIYIASKIYKVTEKYTPSIIRLFASPMIVILITVPLTLIVIGPIAQQLAVWMGQLVEMILKTGVFGGAILGFLWPAIVMTGMHGTTYPITVNSMMVNGYDFLWPIKNLTNMANCGAAFGVAAKTKSSKLRGVAISTGASAFIGICEPAMFGVNIRLKKPFIACMIANGIGGAIMGLFHVTCNILPTTGGVFGFVYYIGPTFIFGMIAIAATIISAFVITYILGFEDDVDKSPKQESMTLDFKGTEMIHSVCEGVAHHISESKDQIFATLKVGNGAFIEPSNGNIVSPVDGKVVTVFPTKHAIGLISDKGTEIIVHMGIDTVNLNGKGFEIKVKEGQQILAGEMIATMDLQLIKEEGYQNDVIVVVTNSDLKENVKLSKQGDIKTNDDLLEVIHE